MFNLLGTDPIIPAEIGGDRATRPSTKSADDDSRLASIVAKPPTTADDEEELRNRWQATAKFEVERARRYVEEFPSSTTARARLAGCLYSSGNDDAVIAAIETLELARFNRDAETSAIDTPALYVAFKVLSDTGHGRTVLQFRDVAGDASLKLLVAAAMVAENADDEAFDILKEDGVFQLGGARKYLGYLCLKRGDFRQAVTHLRFAVNEDPNDVDSMLNLAMCYWNLGSARKAIRWARVASQTAPGRRDASMQLLEFLVASRQLEAADDEIRKLKKRRVVETAEFLLQQARIASLRENGAKTLTLLKRASAIAKLEGDEVLHAELEGNVAYGQHSLGQIDATEALQRIRNACRKAPGSLVLISMLGDMLESPKGAIELRNALNGSGHASDSALGSVLAIQARAAFLEGDYDEAVSKAEAWLQCQPDSEIAAQVYASWLGQWTEDWAKSAEILRRVARRGEASWSVVNGLAYSLSLSGRAGEAEEWLRSVGDMNFYLKATAGLAALASGDVHRGASLYREAAQLAERTNDRAKASRLMVIHQGMAVRRLGLLDSQPTVVRALALPPIDLPEGWERLSAFRFLAAVAKKRGWPWPVVVE